MSKVKNQLRNRPKNQEPPGQPNVSLTGGFRRLVVNKQLNLIKAQIKDHGEVKTREFRMNGTRFLMISQKDMIGNHNPVGVYIHLDDLINYVAHNMFGFEAEENKIVTPDSSIIVPG